MNFSYTTYRLKCIHPNTGMQIVNGVPILPNGNGLGVNLEDEYRAQFTELL